MCVKEEDARLIVILFALPIVVAGMEMLEVRGMVFRVTDWLPLTLHPLPPLPSSVKHWKFAAIETDFVPSALPEIVPLDQGAAG